MCPNCCDTPIKNHPENGCVLAVFMEVIKSRGTLSKKQQTKIFESCDVGALWDDLGPIIDELEDGSYS